MSVIRRVYLYLLAFAGLAMLSLGVAQLGRVLLEVVDGSVLAAPERYVREEVSRWGAAALVGLLAWALHWGAAQRAAPAAAAERASALRRLYLYGVLAGATIGLTTSLLTLLGAAIQALDRPGAESLRQSVEAVPFVVVALVVWAFHWRIASADRARVGEQGGSATLRRWYVYGAAFLGFAMTLGGTRDVLDEAWRAASGAAPTLAASLAWPAATALVGLGLWLAHWRWAPQAMGPTVREQDAGATLRAVYLFLALAVAVWGTLFGASQLLYYALARLLGVQQPGGVGGSLLQAAAGPGSTLAVFGVGWAYQRAAIRAQARLVEAPRQAGVRRLYTALVALLALGALAGGLGGLLWTLADAALNVPTTTSTDWWRNQLALYTMLALVGLPVWLAHWTPSTRIDVAEARSLARRLYVYLALIAGMLVLLGSAAVLLYRLFNLALGERVSTSLTVDLAHALGVGLVAALVAVYHWRTLVADARRAASAPAPTLGQAAGPAEAVVRLRAPNAAVLAEALTRLRERGVGVDVLQPEP